MRYTIVEIKAEFLFSYSTATMWVVVDSQGGAYPDLSDGWAVCTTWDVNVARNICDLMNQGLTSP